MSHHKKIFVNPSHTKKVFANMKRAGKDFSGRITPLFDTMMVQAYEEMGEDSDHPTDSNQIPIVDQPSTSSQPKKKQKSKRTKRKEAEVAQDETEHEESVPTPSNDPLPSEEGPEVGKEEKVMNYMFEKTKESCIEDIDKDAELLEEVSTASIDRYLTEHTDGSQTEQKNQACIFVSIEDVVTKKVNYHLFDGEVELFRFVFLSYLKWLTTFGGSPGPSMPPSFSPGPSKPLSYSPGPSGSAPSIGNAECSNCKFLSENIKVLAGKIKVLEATLEIEMHPENHTLDSTALLHELYNEMGKLGLV
ncbi:hypothetical protein Tco_0487039 [Tanacetum coccineum]